MAVIVVIGAGVIGLSSALRLLRQGHSVTILARDLPLPSETVDARASINYTSLWGGAHNRWAPYSDPPSDPTPKRDHDLALSTYAHMDELCRTRPDAGVTFLKGIEYVESPGREYLELTEKRAGELGIEEFRMLKEGEMPEGVAWGCEYRTWCVNPMVYCSFLLRQVVMAGGRARRMELRDPVEVFGMKEFAEASVVVNCSGQGFGDPNMFITRGQTCLVANSCDVTITRQRADGSWTFNVPRFFDGGTIIGGTKEPDNWDPEPSLKIREKLLNSFAATYPAILTSESGKPGEFRVIADVVGRRPTRRGGPRLEKELVDAVGASKAVVHAYGMGGRGFELSWGVAGEVARMVGEHVSA